MSRAHPSARPRPRLEERAWKGAPEGHAAPLREGAGTSGCASGCDRPLRESRLGTRSWEPESEQVIGHTVQHPSGIPRGMARAASPRFYSGATVTKAGEKGWHDASSPPLATSRRSGLTARALRAPRPARSARGPHARVVADDGGRPDADRDGRGGAQQVARLHRLRVAARGGISRWLVRALGAWEARWCTSRMVADAIRAFENTDAAGHTPMALLGRDS